jgi:transcriptional regulator GlxA family with amidase domain
MSAPPSPSSPQQHRRTGGGAGATLRIRVEEARGLLSHDDDDACHVTLRLAPHEARHSRRTRDEARGAEPVRARGVHALLYVQRASASQKPRC